MELTATSRGTSETTRSWKRQEGFLEPLEGAWPGQHLDVRLLVSETVRERSSVVVRHLVCHSLLQSPYEHDTL